MITPDLICLIADGLRAGTIQCVGGNASLTEPGPTYIDVSTLDTPNAFVSGFPQMFDFQCDCTFVQVKKEA